MTTDLELPGDLAFSAEDFTCDCGVMNRPCLENCSCLDARDRANRILAQKLAKAPEVFGMDVNSLERQSWWRYGGADDTHSARLVCIKERK